jgi:uncharacterized protein YutE (UPF0331/DUF86 family)
MTPLQSEFLSRIGKTLLQVQRTEHLLQICISYFLPEADTLEEIESQAENDRRKTLGQLCQLMRQRIVIDQTFGEQLKQFVSERNEFAHRFLKVDGVSFATDEGLRKGIDFLKNLEAQSIAVRNVVQGLMDAIDDIPQSDEQAGQYQELAKVIFGGK